MEPVWLLGYHADDEIRRWTLLVGVPLALGAAVAIAAAARAQPAAVRRNRLAWGALALSVPCILFGLLNVYTLVFSPFALLALGALVLAVVAARRIPTHGEKAVALVALCATAAVVAVAASRFAACVITDACLH